MPSSRGGRHGYIVRGRKDAYEALRRKGTPKAIAAAIANAGANKAGRSRMANKAARTRRQRKR